MRFAQMLAQGGALGNVRILKAETVTLMGSAQLTSGYPGLRAGQGWGLGVRLIVDPETLGSALPAGSWGWSGAQGTHFWIDPQHRSAAVWMINISNSGGAGAATSAEYERLVSAAAPAR